MPRGDRTRAAAAALGAGGIVTTTELSSGGVCPRLAERAAAAGRWLRLARGVYLTRPGAVDIVTLAAAAAAYIRGPHVVTGLAPLQALGLRWLPSLEVIHVLVPESCRRRTSGRIRVTRYGEYTGLDDTWTRFGARMAPPALAVVDAARHAASLREARGLVLGAVADNWATAPELLELLDQGRRNGSAWARRAIGDAARGCASPPEAELVDALLPLRRPFLVNPEVWRDGVLLGHPDVWVLGTAVGGEVESAERHEGDDQVESTYDRHERFRGGGVELVHLSVARLRRDPDEAARHLLQRADGGPPVPSGLVVVPRGPVLGARRSGG